ncbi:hypothetical protein, partial [Neorhizobium galegae]|uniref:hypothetical protein n=1 Tax=Neorhizobium galegae TaxID=399 RepID=UPI0020365FAC
GIAALAKAMRSHLLPLGVRQDSPNHLQTPQKELESQNRNDQNPDTQQTLERVDFNRAISGCCEVPMINALCGKSFPWLPLWPD